MQKSILFFVTIFLLGSFTANAKSWYVDNRTGATVKDFTSLPNAINAASAGDTILLAGSPTDYAPSGVTIAKNVVIIGPGYFLKENFPGLTAQYTATLGSISISSGATGAQVSGCQIVSACSLNTSNFSLFRNYILCQISIAASVSNIVIKGNYVSVGAIYGINNYCLSIGANCTNILVQNNLMSYGGYNSGYYGLFISMNNTSTGIIFSNNVITTSFNSYSYNTTYNTTAVTTYNSVFSNNIFISATDIVLPTSTNEYYNNISNRDNLPSGNSNLNGVEMSTVIVMNGSPDGYYKLQYGSPAISAGQNGIDIGIYGGSSPYFLSGISAFPRIYSLEIVNVTPQALTVRVKAGATLNQPTVKKGSNNTASPVKIAK